MKKILAITIFLFVAFGAYSSPVPEASLDVHPARTEGPIAVQSPVMTTSAASETLLIYREEITNNEPRLSVLMQVKNDTVINYVLSNELFNGPYFKIDLTEENLCKISGKL